MQYQFLKVDILNRTWALWFPLEKKATNPGPLTEEAPLSEG